MTWTQTIMMDYVCLPEDPRWDGRWLALPKPILLDAERAPGEARTLHTQYPWTEDCTFLLTFFAPYTQAPDGKFSNDQDKAVVSVTTPKKPPRQLLMSGTFPASVMEDPDYHPGHLARPVWSDFKQARLGLLFERTATDVIVGCLFGGIVQAPPSDRELAFEEQLKSRAARMRDLLDGKGRVIQ